MPRTSLQSKKLRHFKLTIPYDGSSYAGWQLQPNGKTVQEVVESALGKIAGRAVRVHGSGRTDAGVHARGQVANCSLSTPLAVTTLLRALNANLPEDIRVMRVQEVDAKFHARFSAKGKEYRYQIDCGPVADPFRRSYAWHHPRPLDVATMRRAARGSLNGTPSSTTSTPSRSNARTNSAVTRRFGSPAQIYATKPFWPVARNARNLTSIRFMMIVASRFRPRGCAGR